MRRSVVLFLLLAVSRTISWAEDKSTPAPKDSSKATVYIYRYKQFVGAALSPSVYCDDVQLARMENGRYFTTTVEPGKHIFRSNDEQSGIVLLAVAGEQYYIRVDIAAGFMKGHGRLNLMSGQQGMYELTSDKLKPLDASKVVDKEKVSVEIAHPQPLTPAARTAPAAPPAIPAVVVPTENTAAPAPSSSQTTQSSPAQPRTQNVSVTTSGLSPGSTSGDQISLGDAAPLAKQKKHPQK